MQFLREVTVNSLQSRNDQRRAGKTQLRSHRLDVSGFVHMINAKCLAA